MEIEVYHWEGDTDMYPVEYLTLGPGWQLIRWRDGHFSSIVDNDPPGERYGQGHPYYRRIA